VCYDNCTVPSAIAQRERVLRASTARWQEPNDSEARTGSPCWKRGKTETASCYVHPNKSFFLSDQSQPSQSPKCSAMWTFEHEEKKSFCFPHLYYGDSSIPTRRLDCNLDRFMDVHDEE